MLEVEFGELFARPVTLSLLLFEPIPVPEHFVLVLYFIERTIELIPLSLGVNDPFLPHRLPPLPLHVLLPPFLPVLVEEVVVAEFVLIVEFSSHPAEAGSEGHEVSDLAFFELAFEEYFLVLVFFGGVLFAFGDDVLESLLVGGPLAEESFSFVGEVGDEGLRLENDEMEGGGGDIFQNN